jgi:putative two-component system response regulator
VHRVGQYVEMIAHELNLEEDEAALLGLAAILHDVGKIGIADSILLKPGKLTEEEFTAMQKHCDIGHSICDPTTTVEAPKVLAETTNALHVLCDVTSPLLDLERTIALSHHEKWDGSGYPRSLAGEMIPIEGRITAVADVFDALSSKRPYKPAFPADKCFAILNEGRGKHFDPRVLDAFIVRKDEEMAIRSAYADDPAEEA